MLESNGHLPVHGASNRYIPLAKDGRRTSSGRLLGICQHRTRTADEMRFGERGVAVEFCTLVVGRLVPIVGQLEGQVPMVSMSMINPIWPIMVAVAPKTVQEERLDLVNADIRRRKRVGCNLMTNLRSYVFDCSIDKPRASTTPRPWSR